MTALIRLVSRVGLAVLAGCIAAAIPAAPVLRAALPDSAPALPAPSGDVVQVSTVSALQAAVNSLASNRTIVIAPGTYQLTSTLFVNGAFANVTIRGATNSRDDVVLVGRGMGVQNGAVPHGIWAGGNVTNLTIANLTIRDVYQHPIIFNAGTESPRVYNVRLINAGQQFLKANPDGHGGGVDNGLVEYSVFEYTNTAPSDYTNAVDVHGGRDWIVRHSLFRRIRAPQGLLAGPAILMWNGTSGSIAEGNTFIDCQREIAFGLVARTPNDHSGGIIRNNFIVRSAGMGGDVAIGVFDSPGTRVVHNTVLMNGQYANAIEYRFADTTNVSIVNNLSDRGAQARNGATGSLAGNVWTASPSWFAGPASADLHLVAGITQAIDRGVATGEAPLDWDGELRSAGGAPDVGADERAGTTAPGPSPPPPPPPDAPPPAPSPSPPPDQSPAPGLPPPSGDPGDSTGRSLRRRSAETPSTGRLASRRNGADRGQRDGIVRQIQVAIGVDVWVIQTGKQLFDVTADLDPSWRVDGLAVTFEGQVDNESASRLARARVLELHAITPRAIP